MRLAPLYDVASDLPYDKPRRTLALGIGGERRLDAIDLSHWQELARQARLVADAVLGRVQELSDHMPDAFEAAFTEVGDPARDMRNRLLPRLHRHLEGVAQRAGLRPHQP